MKSVLLKGPGEVVFQDIPVPEISADEVLVEVKFCGICGSDIHSIPECNLYQAGVYLGHEFSGVIVECAALPGRSSYEAIPHSVVTSAFDSPSVTPAFSGKAGSGTPSRIAYTFRILNSDFLPRFQFCTGR